MEPGFNSMIPFSGIAKEAFDYFVDTVQRQILFWDILRKRGNVYIEHLDDQRPLFLVFKYEVIMDARTFEKPANYALAKIIDRKILAQGKI